MIQNRNRKKDYLVSGSDGPKKRLEGEGDIDPDPIHNAGANDLVRQYSTVKQPNTVQLGTFLAVFRIRIRIRMFLGLLDPHPGQ